MEQLAARCFSPRENAALQLVPEAQRREAFFNCWTRKEAYIKAMGEGLTHPLDQFEVSLKPGEPAQLLFVDGRPHETLRWTFHAFQPADHYTAALAIEGQSCQLRRWDWSSFSLVYC
jgi:4'-phosphopantetheinyl transferase